MHNTELSLRIARINHELSKLAAVMVRITGEYIGEEGIPLLCYDGNDGVVGAGDVARVIAIGAASIWISELAFDCHVCRASLRIF